LIFVDSIIIYFELPCDPLTVKVSSACIECGITFTFFITLYNKEQESSSMFYKKMATE